MLGKITSPIEDLLREQEKLDELRPIAAQAYGPRLCDLAYANPYDGTPDCVLDAIHQALESTRQLSFQYTPYGGATLTRRVIAQDLKKKSGLPYGWKDVILTPGAMAGLNIVFRSLTQQDPDAEIIVITPCWLDYPLYLENLGLKARYVSVKKDDLRLDLDEIQKALTEKTRAIILSQPANPSGVIFDAAELQGLGDMLQAHSSSVLLISDEAHRDFVPRDQSLPLPAQYYPETCTIYSFGKRFLMQGQRIGYIALSPRMSEGAEWAQQLTRLCRTMGFCTPTTLMQIAVRALIKIDIDYSHIFARRRKLVEALRAGGYEVPESDATFFIYPRTPINDDFAFVETLAQSGVLVLPATVFHSTGHFRISVTADEQHLESAAERMIQVLKEMRGTEA